MDQAENADLLRAMGIAVAPRATAMPSSQAADDARISRRLTFSSAGKQHARALAVCCIYGLGPDRASGLLCFRADTGRSSLHAGAVESPPAPASRNRRQQQPQPQPGVRR